MESIGLVLEGGGMRGVYTAGVLEFLSEHDMYFPYIVGVSAGACMAASYLSRQLGRNKIVNVEWVRDPRYISWGNLWRKRELFGMDFIFDEIPNKLVPFDLRAFGESREKFVIGTTDCDTGQTVYVDNQQSGFDLLKALRASSSLPFIAPVVEYEDRRLMDGGISDPIPLRKAERDGFRRNVLILTRNEAYRKSRNRFSWLLRRAYSQYPELVNAMLHRHEFYNETLAYIKQQEQKGAVFVIRPKQALKVGRMERNPAKLDELYRQGYEDARSSMQSLRAWMDGSDE